MLERFLVPKEDQILIESESMTQATKQIFLKMGLSEDDAQLSSEVLMTSDLRGCESHGVSNMLPIYVDLSTKIIMNIAGTDIKEYVEILELMENHSSNITGYEINISCPNVKKGGMEFGVDCDMTAKLTEELRRITDRLIIMKLSPNVSDIVSIGKASQDAGADAVSAINTVVGMSINAKKGISNIYTTYGGLSGPAIKPIGLAAVNKLYKELSVPIIGMGGIVSSTDVAEYILAGSSSVQVGTANFRNPGTGQDLIDMINAYVGESDWKTLVEMIGKVKTYN